MTSTPTKLDAPFYTDEELDALYETDPVSAMRISREQHRLQKQLDAARVPGTDAPPPSEASVRALLEEARGILQRDGGDLEFVALDRDELTVRMKGACSGCPRAALDLKNVVETLVRRRFPQILRVRNVF